MNKKHKKVYKIINYTEQFLILAPSITGCVSTSAFATLLGFPIGITRGLKICATTAVIKKYKSIIKKKKKKHDKIVFLAKNKLNRIEVLISKALLDSYISHEFCFKKFQD